MRIESLAAIPAVVRAISYEPALGPLAAALASRVVRQRCRSCGFVGVGAAYSFNASDHPRRSPCRAADMVFERAVDWVIYGGESGPKFRPDDVAWAREMRALCSGKGMAFFYKQTAALLPGAGALLDGEQIQELPAPRATERRTFALYPAEPG